MPEFVKPISVPQGVEVAIQREARYPGVPADAIPFAASNAAAVTSTTPVAVKAAVTGKKHWITAFQLSQPTPSEAGVLTLQDDTGTPVVLARFGFNGFLGLAGEFSPPIEVAAGKAINLVSSGSVGDAFISLQGFREA